MKRRVINLAAALCALLLLIWPLTLTAADYKSTTYYNIYYDQWGSIADALTSYLDAAFTTPANLLGYNNPGYGKINVYLYSDPKSSTEGYMYHGENNLYLNVGTADTSDSAVRAYASTVSHETTHILFDHETNIYSAYASNTYGYSYMTYLTEALAYYVGDSLYPSGDQWGQSTIGAALSYYSHSGAVKRSWWQTGYDYKNDNVDALDWYQLHAIGYFLANGEGTGKVSALMSDLAQTKNFDTAYSMVYGKTSGQTSTATGSNVNSLYNDYYYYYFGHY